MDEDLHNIDDLFKKALDEHKEVPSETVWENIDKNLDKKKVLFILKKYNKLKWAAAVLFIFSAGMAMYTWHTATVNRKMLNAPLSKSGAGSGTSEFKNDNNKNDKIISGKAEAGSKTNKLRADAQAHTNVAERGSVTSKLSEQREKQKQILPEDNNSEPQISEEKDHANLVSNYEREKRNKENKLKSEKTLARNEALIPGKETAGNTVENSFKQKNNIATGSYVTKESAYKQIAVETELQKTDINPETVNASLQNALATQNGKNRIIKDEKPAIASKNLKMKKGEKSIFSVTVFYSPDFVSSKVDNDQHRFREDDRNEIKKREKIKSSYTTGFLVDMNTGKKFVIESGLTLSSMTTHIGPKLIYAHPDDRGDLHYRFNCSAGYSYIEEKSGSAPAAGDSIPALSSKNVLRYIGVPFAVKYIISKGKLSLHPGVGIAVNFLTKGKIETVIATPGGVQKANINHIIGLKNTYINGSLSLNANYNLNQKLALSFTPMARFALTSINKGAPFKTFLDSYGLGAGLTLKL